MNFVERSDETLTCFAGEATASTCQSELGSRSDFFPGTSGLDEVIDGSKEGFSGFGTTSCQFDFLDGGATELEPIESAETERGAAWSAGPFAPAADPTARRRIDLAQAATIYLQTQGSPGSGEAKTEALSAAGPLFRKLHDAEPEAAERLAKGLVSMPAAGDEFLGFRIVEELGRGAFGRVFMARQGELADRLVALKVTAELPGESQTLAQLQHTNIVPIFSAHHAAPLHAVCMPYFGRATLADLLDDVVKMDSVPDSGKTFVQAVESRRLESASSLPHSSQRCVAMAQDRAQSAVGPVATAAGTPLPLGSPSEALHKLDRLSYVEAVLWIVSRIAAGLAHAHERGILHRDLKPANVLMTDDGQPMILDFNLSEDLKSDVGASAAAAGGTLRYMSPEHIERFLGRKAVMDARSDLFAIGVILFELLTGKSPFATPPSCSTLILHRMIEERRREPPSARQINPAISPAVDSIVRHCLEPDPARRYGQAIELHEDLERHLNHFPLKYAPEPSLPERTRKWLKRHPRIGSSTTIIALASISVLSLAFVLIIRSQKLLRLEAVAESAKFRDEASSIRIKLGHRAATDRAQRREGVELSRHALGRYGVLDHADWADRGLAAKLDPPANAQLRADVAEVLMLLTQATALDAADHAGREKKQQLAQSAQRFNRIAMAAMPAGKEPPQALRSQQAALARLLGDGKEGDRLQAEADKMPLRTARDYYLAAAVLSNRGDYRPALPLAQQAVRLDPQHFWSYFVLGVCQDNLEYRPEAMASFTACIALRPDFAESWLYRGIAFMKRDNPDQAKADFDRAAQLRPDWFEPYLNRSLAESQQNDHVAAQNDLTRALDLGAPATRTYLLRSAERRATGDQGGAEADLAEGLKREPNDISGWLSRGMARLETAPEAALADFAGALKLNPNSLDALQMSAHALSILPGREDDLVRMFDRALTAHPNFALGWSGRGVMLAIRGDRDAALRDAREALWRDTSPPILYQVAGIYATTSKTNPEDRFEAYRLLSSALRAGFGFELLNDDHELDAIRNEPEFRQMVDAARSQSKERLRTPKVR